MIIDVLEISIVNDVIEADMRLSRNDDEIDENEKKKNFYESKRRFCKMTNDV